MALLGKVVMLKVVWSPWATFYNFHIFPISVCYYSIFLVHNCDTLPTGEITPGPYSMLQHSIENTPLIVTGKGNSASKTNHI